MQESQISFQGLSLMPYSDLSPDGQLAASTSLELHGGGLRPCILAGKEYHFDSALKLLCVHSTSIYSHFILWNTTSGNLFYADTEAESPAAVDTGHTFQKVSHASSIGNTLILHTSEGLQYLLFSKGSYQYIGNTPPELNASFGLTAFTSTRTIHSNFTIYSTDSVSNEKGYIPFKDIGKDFEQDMRKGMYQAIEEVHSKGNFCTPFFVRAAYRLYDGSYTKLTPPVLMIPSTSGPEVIMDNVFYDHDKNGIIHYVSGNIKSYVIDAALDMLIPKGTSDALANWLDLIESVEIFVSKPISTLHSEYDSIFGLHAEEYNISSLNNPPSIKGIFRSRESTVELYTSHNITEEIHGGKMRIMDIIHKNEEQIIKDLTNTANFYSYLAIPISNIIRGDLKQRTPIVNYAFNIVESSPDPEVVNLAQTPTLPDSADYQSHDRISADQSFTYNERLHIFNISRQLFNGFTAESIASFTDDGTQGEAKITIFIATTEKDRIVTSTCTSKMKYLPHFLYYPNPKAYRMLITLPDKRTFDLTLKEHPYFNGAYFFYLMDETDLKQTSEPHPEVYNEPLIAGNSLYVSQAGNPLTFPLQNRYTVGTGTILGLSTITTALSQGQFGQFPLIAYTSEGNYALSTNSEGYYGTIHPVQRDVCINPGSIVQTDSQIVFVAARGVMLTSGAEMSCISIQLDGVFDPLPSPLENLDPQPPIDFISNSLIAYDYCNQRIIFMSTVQDEAYCYNLGSRTWNTASFPAVKNVLNVFPYSYVQYSDGKVLRLNDIQEYGNALIPGLIYTRPVKLGSLQLKSLCQMVLQGNYTEPQQITVYGSQDLVSWHKLGTTRRAYSGHMVGHPFKYYRFLIETSLTTSQHLSGLRLAYKTRTEHRLR